MRLSRRSWIAALVLALPMEGVGLVASHAEAGPHRLNRQRYRLRAAVAIAIQTAEQPPGPRPTAPQTPLPTDSPLSPSVTETTGPLATLPEVVMYTTQSCLPCQRARRELSRENLPFQVKIVDATRGGQPEWCQAFPAFAWSARKQTRYVLGYQSTADLIARWRATKPDPAP